jgi:hypothetical protein
MKNRVTVGDYYKKIKGRKKIVITADDGAYVRFIIDGLEATLSKTLFFENYERTKR